jgi:hypothetical protein
MMTTQPLPCQGLRHWNAMARHSFGDIEAAAEPARFSAAMSLHEVEARRPVDLHSSPARMHRGNCTLQQRGRAVRIDDDELCRRRANEPFDIRLEEPSRGAAGQLGRHPGGRPRGLGRIGAQRRPDRAQRLARHRRRAGALRR